MTRWQAGLIDGLFTSGLFSSIFNGLPWMQNRAHAQMTAIEYRQWHPDLITNKGISCYQCGGTEQQIIHLNAKDQGVACLRCKSILWRQATTL